MRRWGYAFLCAVLALVVLMQDKKPASADDGVIFSEQGWDRSDREWWYTVSQGSRILPWDWMQALEQAGSSEKFLSPAHMSSLGYLSNPYRPDGLPIGFVVDEPESDGVLRRICRFFGLSCGHAVERTAWLGMNCAACHTGQMSYGGKTIRVDGAPTLADFQALNEHLLAALKETRETPDKWARFVQTLGVEDADALAKLREDFDRQIAWYDKLEKKNASPLRYGPGRLDAQGHILNKVSLVLGVSDQLMDFPSDAPASYPFIWNATQQDFIQWNGIVQNHDPVVIRGNKTDFGALGRNVGEVIGVFGEVDASRPALKGYTSSVRLDNLIQIERQIGRLHSPRWPAEFPPIDDTLKAKGAALYDAQCAGCHSVIASNDMDTRIKANMQPIFVGANVREPTDIWLACNTFLHRSKSGVLQGRKEQIFAGKVIEPVDDTRFMLENTVIGSILGRGDDLVETFLKDAIFGGRITQRTGQAFRTDVLPGITDETKKARAAECVSTRNDVLRYKARPLNGIWATAPYLHNGSVPTLYDLLLPSRMHTIGTREALRAPRGPVRPDSFSVGTLNFDPKKVGYAPVGGSGGFMFRTHDDSGVPILGNYNSGHDYNNASLTDDERWALVEYLKSL